MLCIHPGQRAGRDAPGPAARQGWVFCQDDMPEQRGRFTGESARFLRAARPAGGAARTGPRSMMAEAAGVTSALAHPRS